MKIIQITDTHLTSGGNNLYNLNPKKNLEACVESINKFHSDADLCIITGDLTNSGDHDAYLDFQNIFNTLKISYFPLIGNHDKRNIFAKVFSRVYTDNYGFIQKNIKIPLGNIILLDTVEEEEDWGSFCEKRGKWFQRQLQDAGNRDIYLFMHHPPFNIGIPALDKICIRKGSEIIENIVKDFSNIKHIFFGHVHRNLSGSWVGIPFSAVRGTNHQLQLDLKDENFLNCCHEPPSYSVILLDKNHTTVHYFEYLDESFFKKIL